MTWLAEGAWAGVALVCATVANSNPFREKDEAVELRHFDPLGLLDELVPRHGRPAPKLRVPVSVLKDVFIDQKQPRQ